MTEKAKNRIRDSYGVNMTVCGDYDQSLSARCENGIFVGRKSESICEFRGIPFAKPPVGKLRWKAPEPVESSDIVMQAYYNGKSPIQTEWPSEQHMDPDRPGRIRCTRSNTPAHNMLKCC